MTGRRGGGIHAPTLAAPNASVNGRRGDLPVAWQTSARPYPESTRSEWNAYLTTGVPHEALTDFPLALDRPHGSGPEWGRAGGGPETSGSFREIQPSRAVSDRIQPDRSSQ
ncbi:DUF317 domain-containing protein [Streptomyces hydrogenans]